VTFPVMTIGSLADVSKAYMIRIAIEEISVFMILDFINFINRMRAEMKFHKSLWTFYNNLQVGVLISI
jgi:hypothetical protein